MKIVLNKCFGSFGLSVAAMNRLVEITGKSFNQCKEDYDWGGKNIRVAPELVQVVEELGSRIASDHFAKLEVVEIPDNATDWKLDNYDGFEKIICVIAGKLHHI